MVKFWGKPSNYFPIGRFFSIFPIHLSIHHIFSQSISEHFWLISIKFSVWVHNRLIKKWWNFWPDPTIGFWLRDIFLFFFHFTFMKKHFITVNFYVVVVVVKTASFKMFLIEFYVFKWIFSPIKCLNHHLIFYCYSLSIFILHF